MGVYVFIFSCIGIGIVLWILAGIISSYNFLEQATISQIGEAGTIMFGIGLISLAVVFLITFFNNR